MVQKNSANNSKDYFWTANVVETKKMQFHLLLIMIYSGISFVWNDEDRLSKSFCIVLYAEAEAINHVQTKGKDSF